MDIGHWLRAINNVLSAACWQTSTKMIISIGLYVL